ncbi:hypothetical protein OG474_03835 [Kribbella sp. NBC_01505]|uniref:hypothetical protein n=1 Tax=Kribbella sp. NBC_01505 TaxID=2903580 RepID=UPI003864F16A
MTSAPALAVAPVDWQHHVGSQNSPTVALTPRYTLHQAPDARSLRYARERFGMLLESLEIGGFIVGSPAVSDDSGWYLCVDDGTGTQHWVRGRGLSSLVGRTFTEVAVFSGLSLGGTGSLRSAGLALPGPALAADARLSTYETTMSAALAGFAGAFRRTPKLAQPVLHWDLPPLHYLLAQLDERGRPRLPHTTWMQWQTAVHERAAMVRRLLYERSRSVGLNALFVRALTGLADTAHGRTPGRAPGEALQILAREDPAWAAAASVRTVESYAELTRLAYSVESLRAGSPDLHHRHGRLALMIEDPAEEGILAEARAIANDAGLSFAAVGLYPLPRLLPSTGGSLYACGF